MTRVRIPAPDIEADVSAEQLADYASGYRYTRAQLLAVFATFTQSHIEGWISARAKEEQRHPSAVLADIVGPAVGSVGAVGARCPVDVWGACGFRGRPWIECSKPNGRERGATSE